MQAKRVTTLQEHKASVKRYAGIAKRDARIAALATENSPEARKQRRAMNDQHLPSALPRLGDAWLMDRKGRMKSPKVRGSNAKLDRINSAHKARKGY